MIRFEEKPVNTKPEKSANGVNAKSNRRADRHSPGYMAEYMRKRRSARAPVNDPTP